MTERRPATLLMIGWAVVLTLGVWSATVVVLGVRRDARAGEVTIGLSLGEVSDWRTASFRVWGDGRYTLFVSTVNFDRPRVGSKFGGEMHIVVRRPDGGTFFDRRFGPGTMDHLMPYNYGDTTLANIPIETARIRSWTVAVRVTRADPQFAGVSSEVKLWRDREDLGMGGLLTYVLIVPAVMFLLLAVFFSFVLARRGRMLPFIASLTITLAFLVLF